MPARPEIPADPSDAPRGRRNPAIRRKRAALSVPEASAGMRILRLSVRASDVVFVKGVIEASEGLAVVFAERGGELTIAAPFERSAELKEILSDLASEVGGEVSEPDPEGHLASVDPPSSGAAAPRV